MPRSDSIPPDSDAFRDEYARLAERLIAWMRRPGEEATEADFDQLALAVFDFQARHNAPYANFCRARTGGENELPRPASWRDIPAVPAEAFRGSGAPFACFPAGDAALRFDTSGTTSDSPGRHYLFSTDLYRASILLGWRRLGLPEHPVAVLTPSPEAAPHSSLSFMMGTLADAFGAAAEPDAFLVNDGGNIRLDALESCIARGAPFLLAGTALAFLHLFESLEREGRALALPPGSWAMETGGYKGTDRAVPKAELYARFDTFLGLPGENVVNEYGMTEISTPFYTTGIGRPHRGPHWARARVFDPETGAEAAPGETGFVVITDLANLGSCIALATSDLAVRREEGFELIGRDPAALPRGCSRAADEFLSQNS